MAETVLFIGGAALLLCGVALSIALHELGHMVPAKRFGVLVTEFMVGFGPRVFIWQRGETKYGIRLLPLGGFVKLHGMVPPAAAETTEEPAVGEKERRAAVESSADSLKTDRSFWRLSARKKIIVMLGGPLVNLFLAAFCVAILISVVGVAQHTKTVASVIPCLPQNSVQENSAQSQSATAVAARAGVEAGCDADQQVSPAVLGGVQAGDELLAINGVQLRSGTDASAVLNSAATTDSVTVLINRNGLEKELELQPVSVLRPVTDAAGRQQMTAAGQPRLQETRVLGVAFAVSEQPQPLTAVPAYFGSMLRETVLALPRLPERVGGVAQTVFNDGQRDLESPVSIVGVGRIAGEVASAPELSSRAKIGLALSLLASLNLMLFVFNLLPLLPLDGGRIAVAFFEGVRRHVWRLRGKPDPGPAAAERLWPVTLAVVVLFIAMTLLLVYADIVKPLRVLP